MPFVRISVTDKMPIEKRQELPKVVYDAMRASINIPESDLFVALHAHGKGELVADPKFMGMQRTANFTLVHITLRRGRTVEMKQKLYREIARLAEERAGIAPDDVMIVLSENGPEDWSFGKGVAQFVEAQKPEVSA
ncbi:tautomerase family protein [Pseudacidobacterium ailaaui]|uniref:tautomerase family protein n=1 Tax=Pseudacidobacterium ailaaui TaxID=1382359 RepID=UPI00047AAC19|nr:tautomerase family protein [Pseudacidobacterium ailaaui]